MSLRRQILLCVLAANCLARADVILDPKVAAKLLAEIGKAHQESATAADRTARMEALYEMGKRIVDLAGLMTKDLEAHGSGDPTLNALILKRLKECGITIRFDGETYMYDLAAFREIVRRSPKGKLAADARYAVVGFEASGNDPIKLKAAIGNKEQFIRDYPQYPEMSVVKFLLARDHLRLGSAYEKQNDVASNDRHQKIAYDLFREIIRLYPNSPEAENAAANLAMMKGPQ